MKVTKRILAIVMAMLMIVSSCVVAGSAAGDLQAAINAAVAGETVTMSADTTESVVIDKDLTLDLGGNELKGVPGSPAITIEGANVTILNGYVVSQFANVKSLVMLETVVDESPAAIYVKGGSVTVEGIRAVGSMTRIPTTDANRFPTGSAITLTDGAEATITQSSLIGRYGVNNKETGAAAGGNVTINDAVMVTFMRAVKDSSKEIVAADTEKVNASEFIEEYLNSGIKLEDRERNFAKNILGDKVILYTKSAQVSAASTYFECTDKVTVEAQADVSNIRENSKTDCSYKYVPEYVVLADGTLVEMTLDGDTYTAQIEKDQASGIQIRYRLVFDMQPDVKDLIGDPDAFLQSVYAMAVYLVKEAYKYADEKYTTYTQIVGNIAKALDEMGNLDQSVRNNEKYQGLHRAVYNLGGATVWNASHPGYTFGNNQYKAIYGNDKTMPADGIVGTIDRVAKLKKELESIVPFKDKDTSEYLDDPFADQSKWADLGYWAFENYEEVLSIADEAVKRLGELQTILDDEAVKAIISSKKELQDKRATFDKVQSIATEAKAVLDKITQNSVVQYVFATADDHSDEIKPYINKFVSIYNNRSVYFTASNIVEGNFAKTYALTDRNVTENAPILHSFTNYVSDGNATCTADGTKTAECDNGCGAKDTIADVGSMIAHSFTNYVSDGNATCTADGTKTAQCDYGCGASDTIADAGSKLGHDYVAVVTDPTCMEGGYTTYTCSRCSDTYYDDLTDALDHDYDDGVVTKEATCTETGTKLHTCKNDATHTYEETIPAKGHEWGEWTVTTEPGCLTAGKETRKCNNCDATEEKSVAALGHDYKIETTPATCTENGSTTFTCTRCTEGTEGHTKPAVIIPALGHSYEAETTDATCTQAGLTTFTCSRCSDTYTANEVDPLGHSYEAETTEATCTTEGFTTYTCSRCGDTYTDNTVPALGHSYEAVTVEPTCTTDGYTTFTCTRCAEGTEGHTKPTVTIPALGHSYDVVTTAPTCTTEGKTTYTCSRCQDTYSDNEVPALGHTFDESIAGKVNTVEATCTTDGSKTITCVRCDQTTTVVLPKLGHSYDAETTFPTCTEEGYVTYTCTRCADGTDGHSYVDSTKIPALGHTFDESKEGMVNITKPATCTETGTKTVTCWRCENATQDEEIPALGHAYDYELVEVSEGNYTFSDPAINADTHKIIPATMAHGVIHVFICTHDNCSQEYRIELTSTVKPTHEFVTGGWTKLTDPDPENGDIGKCRCECIHDDCTYVAIQDHVVPAADDEDEVARRWTFVEGSATCYFNGYDEGICVNCGETARRLHTSTNEIQKHSFISTWLPDPDGAHHYKYCTKCIADGVVVSGKDKPEENTYMYEEHNFDEWEYLGGHTFFKNGKEQRTCLGCQYREEREAEGTSILGRIIGKILALTTIPAWIYTHIAKWIALKLGLTDTYFEIPFDFLRKK